MIRVYLIRHGQSIYQSLKIVSGMNEFGLSGIGKVQSVKIGQILSSIRFDQVYSSDFKRCVESYEYIEKQLKHKPRTVTFTHMLRERDPGNDLLKSYSEVYPLNPQTVKESNAETSEEIQERAKLFFQELITNQQRQLFYEQPSIEEINQMILNQSLAEQQYNFIKPSIQSFSSSQKLQDCSHVMVMSHAGFIAEAITYLYKREEVSMTDGIQPVSYARNGALFLIDIHVNDAENWKCNFQLRNYSKKIVTPFEQLN